MATVGDLAAAIKGLFIDAIATCSDARFLKTISIRDAKKRLTELAREVEAWQTIVVIRDG